MAKKKTTKPAATAALRSAKHPRKHLIDIGARYNLESLTTQASVVLAKVEAQNSDAAADEHFADYGFDAGWISSVQQVIAQTAQASDAQGAVAVSALPTAAALEAALATAKNLRRQGVTAIAADPTRSSPMGFLGSGASVPETRRGLAKVATLIAPTTKTPSGTGKDFRAKAQAALKALDAAQKTHRAALGKLSPAVASVHANKGILQQELKSAARIARTVSPADAHLYAPSSHVHVHERSRKRPAKANGASAASPASLSGSPAAKAGA